MVFSNRNCFVRDRARVLKRREAKRDCERRDESGSDYVLRGQITVTRLQLTNQRLFELFTPVLRRRSPARMRELATLSRRFRGRRDGKIR